MGKSTINDAKDEQGNGENDAENENELLKKMKTILFTGTGKNKISAQQGREDLEITAGMVPGETLCGRKFQKRKSPEELPGLLRYFAFLKKRRLFLLCSFLLRSSFLFRSSFLLWSSFFCSFFLCCHFFKI